MKLTRLAFTAFLLTTFAPAARADGESTSTLPRPDPEVAEFARGVKFTVNGYTGTEVLTNFSEVSRTVNGNVRLYYANSLEALETSTDYLQISPPSFPVEDKDAGTTENIPARFYRLKIETE